MMTTLLGLLLSINSLTTQRVPAGTQLHIRLTSSVGSYASRVGSPVSAVLIAPVVVENETLLPAGSTLSGRVTRVARVGLGIRHETAGLDLDFKQVKPWDIASIPISTRVAEVDNGRERVTRNGHVQGVRATDSLCYRVSGYVRTALQWEVHAKLAVWAIRSLLVQLPEPEIYYPAGVELTLTVTEHLLVTPPLQAKQIARQLTLAEHADLDRSTAGIPYQTYAPVSRRSSDLTNMVLIGSQDQILSAFSAAGWTQADPASFRRRIAWIRAVAERRAYGAGPMSPLLLQGAEPNMSWEKGLNDVSKRHHVRIWKAGTWHGQELWIGAATRDIDFGYLRPGQNLTHRIEKNIDQERDKIAYDLAFTGCADLLDWVERPGFPRVAENATGDPMSTDTRVAVIELNNCQAPRLSTETFDLTPLAAHGGKLHRFARREILTARNDLIRGNIYWRSYEVSRWLVGYASRRMRQEPLTEAALIKAPAASSYGSR
jgi:hypothetical protein